MTFPSKKHSQFELFPGSLDRQDKSRKRISLAPITVTWENAVIGIIVFVMGMIVMFSFGVEKGKTLKRQSTMNQGSDQKPIVVVEKERQVSEMIISENSEEIAKKSENLQKNTENNEIFSNNTSKKNKSIDKLYSVQVASFKYKQRAERMASDISRSGYDAFAVEAGSHYVVCIGRFPDKERASDMRRTLLNKYPDCLIRSL